MKSFKYALSAVLFFLVGYSNEISAQVPYYSGAPLIRNYLPSEYGASSQNWAFAEAANGLLYVANTQALMAYDGKNWELISSENPVPVRSLDTDLNNRVYVGKLGDFGYLAADSLGSLNFVSLKQKAGKKAENIGNIWRTIYADSAVWYFTENKIFCYRQDSIYTTEMKMEAFFGFEAYDKLFVLKKDSGLYMMQNNRPVKLPHTDFLNSSHRMYYILEYKNEQLLIATRNDGIYKYDLKAFKKSGTYNFNIETDAEQVIEKFSDEPKSFFAENVLYSGVKINNDLFAFGTIAGGIALINGEGKLLQIINKRQGLNSNCIYALYLDRFGNLQAAMQNGIANIQISYPLSEFSDEKHGLSGYVLASALHRGKYYVSTMAGVYLADSSKIANFIELNKKKAEFWCFEKAENALLTGGAKGIYQIDDNRLVKKDNTRSYTLHYSKHRDKILYVSSDKAFFAFRVKINNGGSIRLQKFLAFEGVNSQINKVNELSKHELWLSSLHEGIYQIKIKDSLTDYSVQHFTEKDGLPVRNNIMGHYIEGNQIFASQKGLFRFNEKSGRFEGDDFFGKRFHEDSTGIMQIFKLKDRYLLSSERLRTGYLSKQADSFVFENDFSVRFPNYYQINYRAPYIEIYTGKGLYVYNTEKQKSTNQDFNTLIRKVFVKQNDSVLFKGNFYLPEKDENGLYKFINTEQNENLIPVLRYENNALVFEFAAAFFEKEEKTQYFYRLEGFEDDWQENANEGKAVYTNLPEGEYTFVVKAENIYGQESKTAEYRFSILPPWYRTWWAYIAYIIIASATVRLIIKLYNRRLIRKNKELEQIVAERTSEIMLQKEEIQAQAEKLELANTELEKLSIVAGETDNAVIITDSEGNITWLNKGFTRLYGYTREEFIKQFGKSIIDASSSPKIKEIVKSCIENKKSAIYESNLRAKNGDKLWLQTTLTPILNNKGKVEKLVTIDTDIRKIKEAEQEILQKNEEIISQKEELEKQNKKIVKQNRKIQSSIEYALTIQNGILPLPEQISEYFEHFIFYKPKDIVSGDFYWFTKIEQAGKKYIFLAVIDCTGHGVPGAFMSMIGNRMLSSIISEKQIVSPDDILEELDQKVVQVLKQKHSGNRDGMDVCLCRLEQKTKQYEISFAGAKRPLFYSSDGKIKRLKGTRRTIGGDLDVVTKQKFENHRLEIPKGEQLYLSTDGFIDQNNPHRKRYGTPRFTRLLERINRKPLAEQARTLEDELKQWQKKQEQRDDITIIGLRL